MKMRIKMFFTIKKIVVLMAIVVVSATVLMADWDDTTNPGNIFTTTDKVGIGTNNPLMKLHVSGGSLAVTNTNHGNGNWGGGETSDSPLGSVS